MIAFIHVAKAAGTTMSGILRRNYGIRHFDTRFFSQRVTFTAVDLRRIRKVYPRLDSIAGHEITPVAELHVEYPEIRYFTFLRDPIVRTVSQFQFFLQSRRTDNRLLPSNLRTLFQTFVRSRSNSNMQTRYIARSAKSEDAISVLQEHVGFVGLVEEFDESLVLFRDWVGQDLDIRYRRLNKTSMPSQDAIRHELLNDRQLRRDLLEANREDQLVYDYVRNEAFPAQRARYGGTLSADVKKLQESNLRSPVRRLDTIPGKFLRNFIYKPIRPYLFDRHAA